MNARVLACLLVAAPLLGGCLSDRTFGESLDDSSAATEIKARLFGAGGFGRFGEVDVAVVDKFVLLSGRVPTDVDRKEAERIAWQVASVDEVANELQIEKWDIGRDMNDSWITEQVRLRLVADNDIKGTNFNIQVHNSVVYLLGTARTDEELRKAAEHASLVNGVQKVVSYVKMRERGSPPPDISMAAAPPSDLVDRPHGPCDAFGFLAVFLAGDAAREQHEAIDHRDIHFHEAAIEPGAEQARLHLGGRARVIERLAEGAVGQAPREKRRGKKKAGQYACSHDPNSSVTSREGD